MSIRGVYQLMRLELKYCDHGGSSRHLRNFLENHLKTLREEWSHLDITTTVRRGRHPHVTGTYRNGRQKTVDLKNKEEEDQVPLELPVHREGEEIGHQVAGEQEDHGYAFDQGRWRPGMWDTPTKSAGAAAS